MDQQKKPTYKYCIVPKCKNTTTNAPGKVFFLVPRGANVRKMWCKIMRRAIVSPSTCLYCCEDHFNVEEDTYNYMEYKIMNLQEKHKTTLRLKKGVLPHKFQCQKDIESPPPPDIGIKRSRLVPESTDSTNVSEYQSDLEYQPKRKQRTQEVLLEEKRSDSSSVKMINECEMYVKLLEHKLMKLDEDDRLVLMNKIDNLVFETTMEVNARKKADAHTAALNSSSTNMVTSNNTESLRPETPRLLCSSSSSNQNQSHVEPRAAKDYEATEIEYVIKIKEEF